MSDKVEFDLYITQTENEVASITEAVPVDTYITDGKDVDVYLLLFHETEAGL